MPGIPFIRDFKFDYGTAMEVTPLIRRVVANNPNPFTFKGTGTYIVGHGKVAVVDPGPDQQDHIDAVLVDGLDPQAQPGQVWRHLERSAIGALEGQVAGR